MTIDELMELAKHDANILAFWLDGSRGKGRATAHSDYDCTVIVSDASGPDYRAKSAGKHGDLDCRVMTLDEFRRHADWNSPTQFDRYNFAYLKALVDKTGEAQLLIDEKGKVPPDRVQGFIDNSLDHAINQIYRALKCLRDGDASAARLEAAEGVAPILDAIFALNGGRLRPYYKYLVWDLEAHPLEKLPWPSAEVPQRMNALLDAASGASLRETLLSLEDCFRTNGHGTVFDGWGDALAWMKS